MRNTYIKRTCSGATCPQSLPGKECQSGRSTQPKEGPLLAVGLYEGLQGEWLHNKQYCPLSGPRGASHLGRRDHLGGGVWGEGSGFQACDLELAAYPTTSFTLHLHQECRCLATLPGNLFLVTICTKVLTAAANPGEALPSRDFLSGKHQGQGTLIKDG